MLLHAQAIFGTPGWPACWQRPASKPEYHCSRMPSAVFSSYLEEQAELCANAGRAIASLRAEADMDARRAAQTSAEAELVKADELMQQMDLEARSAPKPEAKELQSRVKTCRSEVGALRASLKQAIISGPPRSAGGGCSSGDEAGDSTAERARLLKMGERLHDGTSKLKQAHKTVLETEQIGISILGDLKSQRETIMHSTGTLQRANESLARSKRTLSAIGRRAFANKLIMWVLIILLGAAVLLLMYLQIFGMGGGGDGSGAAATARNHTRTRT